MIPCSTKLFSDTWTKKDRHPKKGQDTKGDDLQTEERLNSFPKGRFAKEPKAPIKRGGVTSKTRALAPIPSRAPIKMKTRMPRVFLDISSSFATPFFSLEISAHSAIPFPGRLKQKGGGPLSQPIVHNGNSEPADAEEYSQDSFSKRSQGDGRARNEPGRQSPHSAKRRGPKA